MRLSHAPRLARLLLIVGIFHTAAMVWIAVSALGYGDFPQLHDSARALLAGTDLYVTGPTIQGTKNLNPPHLAILMAPLGALSLPIAAFVMWGIILMAASVYAAAIARTISSPKGYFVFAVVLASAASGVAISLINLAWPLAAATAWAWIWQREGRLRRSALAIGCLASFKVFYLLFVPYWLWRRDFTSALWSVAAFCAVIGTGFLIVGFAPYSEWLTVLRNGSPLSIDRPLDASWHSVVTRLPLDHGSALVVWITGCAVGVAATWRRLRHESDTDVHWALVLTVMIILSPLGWVYYALIPALPAARVLLKSRSTWVMPTIAAGSTVPPAVVVLTALRMHHWIPSAIASSFYALTMMGVWLALVAGRADSLIVGERVAQPAN